MTSDMVLRRGACGDLPARLFCGLGTIRRLPSHSPRGLLMDASSPHFDTLIRSAARRLKGHQRRLFMAEVTTQLCQGSARQAERRFGWGRDTVDTGLHEASGRIRCVENFVAKGRRRSEDKYPTLAADIRAIVEPHTQADPELK